MIARRQSLAQARDPYRAGPKWDVPTWSPAVTLRTGFRPGVRTLPDGEIGRAADAGARSADYTRVGIGSRAELAKYLAKRGLA